MILLYIEFEKLKEFIKTDEYYNFLNKHELKYKLLKQESYISNEKYFEILKQNYYESLKYNIRISTLDYIEKDNKIYNFYSDDYYCIKLKNIYYFLPKFCCSTANYTKILDESENSLQVLDSICQITKYQEEVNCVENKYNDELIKLNTDLEKLKADIEAKKREMEDKIENLKDKIFIVKSALLKFRTLMGDSFEIHQLRSGKRTDKDIPLIIYQKFRFLDEEMIKMSNASYENWSVNYDTIAEFFSKDDIVFNTFCPNDKCISVFRNCSEKYASIEDIYGKLIYEIEFWRANQIGILIRDGENLWLIWVDEEITIKNNLFMTDKSNDKDNTVVLNQTRLRSCEVINIRNRELLLIIISNLIKSKLLDLENSDLDIFNNKSIIFSSADNFIDDNRYPSLSNWMYSFKTKKGDKVFLIKSIAGERWSGVSDRYYDTSYGEYNRGYNARIDKYKIVPINIVLEETKYNYRKFYIPAPSRIWSRAKDDYVTRNVNIEVYSDEFINLKYVTLDMVNYWIDSKNVGSFKYVEVINALKELKKYLLKEKENARNN